jgi:hypothetical protein
VFGAAACTGGGAPGDLFSNELARAKGASLPSEAKVLREFAPEAGGTARRIGWEIQTKMAWDEYRAAVQGRLAGYERLRSNGASISFVKQMSGDSLSVSLDKIGDGPPLRVQVFFVAVPD